MNYATASRVLALVGITINGVGFSYWNSFWYGPLFNWFAPWFLAWTAVYLTFCIMLPVVGYGEIKPHSKGAAAAMLIVSGIASPMIGNLTGAIGGIVIALAGGLTAAWQPVAKGGN
jgi:hypothetical protein